MARRLVRRHRDLRQMLGWNCVACSALTSASRKKACISRAEIAQPHAGIARRPALDEFGDRLLQQRVVVVQFLEGDQRR